MIMLAVALGIGIFLGTAKLVNHLVIRATLY